MELHLSLDRQVRLAELASRTGREADELLREAVDRLLEYESWFAEKVATGRDQIERGEVVTHEAVGARVERLFRV